MDVVFGGFGLVLLVVLIGLLAQVRSLRNQQAEYLDAILQRLNQVSDRNRQDS